MTERKFQLNYDVVILDYSTSEIRCVNLPADLVTRDTQSEDIEEYLRNNCGFRDDTCYWMGLSKMNIIVPDSPETELFDCVDKYAEEVASRWPKGEPVGERDDEFDEFVSEEYVEDCQKSEKDIALMEAFSAAVYEKIKNRKIYDAT